MCSEFAYLTDNDVIKRQQHETKCHIDRRGSINFIQFLHFYLFEQIFLFIHQYFHHNV